MTNRATTKKLPAAADALAIVHSWVKDDPKMQAMLAEERSTAAIARQIHALRTKRGLTQRQLADLIGTKQPVIARLEDADYEGPSFAMLYRIGAALGCGVSVKFIPHSSRTVGRVAEGAGPAGRGVSGSWGLGRGGDE